jgi:Tfp pilus assembly protein PilN
VNELTVLNLGANRLVAVTAKANGQGPQIVRSGSAELTAVEAAPLRAAAEKCGVAGERVALVVERGRAILRDLELPEGSPEELVSMVRFQVERELPLPLEQVRYSYVETGRAGGKVRVQVAAVPRDLIDPALAAAEGAGLKVSGVYVSSYGLLALSPNGEPAVLIEVAGGEAEILVASGGRMEFSRTASLGQTASADALAREVDRTLRAYAAKAPGTEVRKVVLAGEGAAAAELAKGLGELLARPVAQAGPGDLETAPAAGLCLGILKGRPIPDLLHPPVLSRRFRPKAGHRIGALAALVAVMLIVWSQVAIADKRGELERKRAELKALEPRVASVNRMHEQSARALQWSTDRKVWFETLEMLQKIVNPTNLWISGATFDETGSVRLQGKAQGHKDVTAFVTALEKSGQFTAIKADKNSPNNDRNTSYKQDFVITGHLAGFNGKAKK